MKKLCLMLLILPLVAVIASCSDDDDRPSVNITLTYGNARVVDGQVYVVKPDTFKVERVKVTATRKDKVATNGTVIYRFPGFPPVASAFAPYGCEIITEKLPLGKYDMSLEMPIMEEGCELANALIFVTVNIVENESDIPSSPGGDTDSMIVSHTFE